MEVKNWERFHGTPTPSDIESYSHLFKHRSKINKMFFVNKLNKTVH